MKITKFFVFLFLFFISPFTVFAQTENSQTIDQINNFNSEITIEKNTSISIKETLEYETNLDKHGIYRYIPYRYTQNNLNYTAQIKNIKITDDTYRAIPFSKSQDTQFITLKIGDPNSTFTGKKTYLISYTIENALKRFDKYDELYWDITGEGWQIPVLSSQAIINSPYAKITDINCFSGLYGSNDNLCVKSFEGNTAIFTYQKEINYGSNFTVLLALDQNNQIIFPTKFQNFLKTLLDNWFILLTIFPLIFVIYRWNTKGRDQIFLSPNIYAMDENAPQKKKPLFGQNRKPFHYEPIKNLTPGQAGTLIDEKIDNQDIIAEIIDLARQKYLKLESIEKKNIFSKKDYLFTKLKESGANLPEHQKYLFESIFKSGPEIKLSSLKGSFYDKMAKTKELINKSMESQKLFVQNPSTSRLLSFLFIIFVGGTITFISFGISNSYDSALPFLSSLFSNIIAMFFAYQMPSKTAIGNNYYLQAKGLKQMITYGKWREEIHEKNLFIEEVLPFAIALGVVDKLAKDMEELNIKAPDYLDANMRSLTAFSTANFINSFSSTASSNLSYNPNSSSYSGGSGFSGGGSSGGGGGGGGGGSW